MSEVLDRNGKAICKSQNLAGIRRYVSKNTIKQLDIAAMANGRGKLSIAFDNGSNFATDFASFVVLRDFVRRWRNAYGYPLSVSGRQRGKVDSSNKALHPQTMTMTDHERNEWQRVANAARSRGNEPLAKRFEHAILQPELLTETFDNLADIYRNWLVFNELP